MIDRSLFLSPDGQTFDGKRAVPNEAVTKLMLDLAELTDKDTVLEIGSGSGYQTAVWASTGARIFSIERCGVAGPLDDGGLIRFTRGDGMCGWPFENEVPPLGFDCAIITCGVTRVSSSIEGQIREGGRAIIPLGNPEGQELLRLEKRNGKLVMGRVGGYCRFQMCS